MDGSRKGHPTDIVSSAAPGTLAKGSFQSVNYKSMCIFLLFLLTPNKQHQKQILLSSTLINRSTRARQNSRKIQNILQKGVGYRDSQGSTLAGTMLFGRKDGAETKKKKNVVGLSDFRGQILGFPLKLGHKPTNNCFNLI